MTSASNTPSGATHRDVFQGVTVLVVEDHEDSREALVTLLEVCGFTVQAVGSVRAAIETFERSHPHVIVSDLGLPDGDGCDFMGHVRRHSELARIIPALAVSAFMGPQAQARALAAGFNVCMPKPLNLELLLQHLAVLLDAGARPPQPARDEQL